MTIDLKNQRIYNSNENGKLNEHTAFSTDFSHFEILKDGKILVMEDYYDFTNGVYSNLYCVNENAEVEWFAENRKKNGELDYYVEFTNRGNRIYANTWDCFRIEIDIDSGKIISAEFTK